MDLVLLRDSFAVCRLDKEAPLPAWALSNRPLFIARTDEELSFIVPDSVLPPQALKVDKDWRGLRVQGPLDFSLVGVLASLLAPLAGAGIPILAVSTFATDYIFVKGETSEAAAAALEQHGHKIIR